MSSIKEQLTVFKAKLDILESPAFVRAVTSDIGKTLHSSGWHRNCTHGFSAVCNNLKPIFKLDMQFDNDDIPASERAKYNEYKERLFEVIRNLNNFYRNDCPHGYNPIKVEEAFTACKIEEGTAISDDILPTIKSILLPKTDKSKAVDYLSDISKIAGSQLTYIPEEFLIKYYNEFTDNVEFGGFNGKGSLLTSDAIISTELYESFFRKFTNILESEYHTNIIQCINGIQELEDKKARILFVPFLICLTNITWILSSSKDRCVLNETNPSLTIVNDVVKGYDCKIHLVSENVKIWVNLLQNTFIIFLLVVKEKIPESLEHSVISKGSIEYIYKFIDALFKIVGYSYSGVDICQHFTPFVDKVNGIVGYELLEQSAPNGYTCGRGIIVKTCDSDKSSRILIHTTVSDLNMDIDTAILTTTCGGKRESKKRRSNKRRSKRSKPRKLRRTRRPKFSF